MSLSNLQKLKPSTAPAEEHIGDVADEGAPARAPVAAATRPEPAEPASLAAIQPAAPRTRVNVPTFTPKAESAPVAAASDPSPMSGDLGNLSARPADDPAASAPAPAAKAAPADGKPNLADMVKSQMAAASAPSDSSALTGSSEPSPEATPESSPRVPAALEGLDESLGIPAAPEPKTEEKAPAENSEVPAEQMLHNPGLSVDTVMRLLRSGGSDDEELHPIANDFISQVGAAFLQPRRDISVRQQALDAEEARLKALETGRQSGGGGGLVSALAGMLRSDPRAQHRKARQALNDDKEALHHSTNRAAESIRDRIYSVKKRQYEGRMLELGTEGQAYSNAIGTYNEAILNSEAAQPFAEAVKTWAKRDGLSMEAAVAAVGKGAAPKDVMDVLAAVKDKAMAEPEVADMSRRMYEAQDRLASVANQAHRDADLLSRNFHDREFDAENCRDELLAGFKQMAEQFPDPIAEDESRQKMRERMQELMDGIRKSFEAVIEAVMNALIPTRKA